MPDWLREIDHTADIGIQVTAPDRDTLYARAAEGMFTVLTDLSAVQPRTEEPFTVTAPDAEALMVRWLSELNFHHSTTHRLFCEFDVEVREEPDALVLEGRARGESIDLERHVVFTEIKAVTFHDLAVAESEGMWSVQVIFDM
jgi:SHS2 domain-containing protein